MSSLGKYIKLYEDSGQTINGSDGNGQDCDYNEDKTNDDTSHSWNEPEILRNSNSRSSSQYHVNMELLHNCLNFNFTLKHKLELIKILPAKIELEQLYQLTEKISCRLQQLKAKLIMLAKQCDILDYFINENIVWAKPFLAKNGTIPSGSYLDSMPKNNFNSRPTLQTPNIKTRKISPFETYTLHFDGASLGNPGNAGIGWVIELGDKVIAKGYDYIGHDKTNNLTEYIAMLTGIEKARDLNIKNLDVKGDSMLVINQINGLYKVKCPHLVPLYQKTLTLQKDFTNIKFSYVPREKNKIADELANQAVRHMTSKCFYEDEY